MVAKKTFRFQLKPQEWVSYQTGARVQSNSKVTVPRPFKMMLREEERKKHRVRTRSEIELENTLLKRELEELRECQKKFTASPAPAHIHLPLYEIISARPRSRNSSDHFRETNQERTKVTPKPFKFLERERRKREAKIAAELVKFGQKDQRAFKARALPSSVYRNRHGTNTSSPCLQHQRQTVFIMERETAEGQWSKLLPGAGRPAVRQLHWLQQASKTFFLPVSEKADRGVHRDDGEEVVLHQVVTVRNICSHLQLRVLLSSKETADQHNIYSVWRHC